MNNSIEIHINFSIFFNYHIEKREISTSSNFLPLFDFHKKNIKYSNYIIIKNLSKCHLFTSHQFYSF